MIILAKKNTRIVESLVDRLYNSDSDDQRLRCDVARMLCKGPALSLSRIEDIIATIKEKYPKNFEAKRKTSMANVIWEVRNDITELLSDANAVQAIAEELNMSPEAIKDTYSGGID